MHFRLFSYAEINTLVQVNSHPIASSKLKYGSSTFSVRALIISTFSKLSKEAAINNSGYK
jgi:hypothetical protein